MHFCQQQLPICRALLDLAGLTQKAALSKRVERFGVHSIQPSVLLSYLGNAVHESKWLILCTWLKWHAPVGLQQLNANL